MSEVIGGMRVIKMYCWEKPFGKLIDTLRQYACWSFSSTTSKVQCCHSTYIYGTTLTTFVIFCRSELALSWKCRIMDSVVGEFGRFNEHTLSCIVIVVYIATQSGHISAVKVFPMITIVEILSDSVLEHLPWGLKAHMEVSVSAKRIEVSSFLNIYTSL